MAAGWQLESVTYLCAQRALKEGVVIRKRQGEPQVPPPLVRSVAAQATFMSVMSKHIRRTVISYPRARGARPYE